MGVEEIAQLLNAQVICNNSFKEDEFEFGFSSDLMSDVLTIDVDNLVLLTGLTNVQTIRTAEMADIRFIVFVRNKKVNEEIINLANENGMTILESPFSMFRSSAVLFNAGLKPVY